MYENSNPATRLFTSDVDNIRIRGRNLCDKFVGCKKAFTDCIVFHFSGTEPAGYQLWQLADDAVPYEAP